MKEQKFYKYGDVKIGSNVFIYSGCRFGLPKEVRIVGRLSSFTEPDIYKECMTVYISDNVIIGNDALIYEGCKIGIGVILEDRIRIGFNCDIGANTRLMYGAYICDRVQIGDNCRVAGFVCDGVRIGLNSTVMGNLVHSYTVPDDEWGVEEPAPIIGEQCVIGYGATIVGGIRIGNCSYIGAGAIVTKDVPSNTIVVGKDKHISITEWSGERLKKLYQKRE